MKLEPGECYHVYTRGNNRERVFFQRRNYLYFLRKLRHHLLPHLDILAYCLMPTHFHLLVRMREDADPTRCNVAYRTLLSSYTRAIQLQEGRTGSLFQQNSKAKNLADGNASYGFTCFCYIHQNPLRDGLVADLADWPYSSYLEYAGLRKRSLCHRNLATEMFDLPDSRSEFQQLIRQTMPEDT